MLIPKAADVSAILGNVTSSLIELPFIDRRDYMSQLALVAANPKPKAALVVVAPKSSGKSEGLQRMISTWQRMGHLVVDIDLKGVDTLTFARLLKDVESKLISTFDSLDGSAYSCVGSKLGAKPFLSFSTLLLLVRHIYDSSSWLTSVYAAFVTALGATLVFFGVADVQVQFFFQQRWKLFAALLLPFAFLVFAAMFTYQHLWREPLSIAFKDGDFSRIMDTYNVLAACDPAHRPILVVREVQNMDSASSDSLFYSLEKMKQGSFHFPVILETSDFLWYNKTATKRSFLSFKSLYLEDMEEHDVRADVVDKFGIWTPGEFSRIWDAVGGHGGSLAYLFAENKVRGDDLAVAIETLDKMHGEMVGSALNECGSHRDECKTWLKQVRDANFTLAVEFVPESIHALFESNVLFMKRDNFGCSLISTQNRLLARAIARFVAKVMPDDFNTSDVIVSQH